MSRQSKCVWMACAALTCWPLFVAAIASGADLPCVQQAIAWKNASPLNTVTLFTVALHANGIAAYATGDLSTASCTRAPYAAGTVSCLKTSGWVDALLSDRLDGPQRQRFDVHKPLLLAADVIPADNLAQVHLRQPSAAYDFDPRCVGDLLIGNDQWGNHWTMAFGKSRNPN